MKTTILLPLRQYHRNYPVIGIGVVLLLLIFATRLYYIRSFPPFLDEGLHLQFAETILNSGPFARAEEGRLFTIWWYLLFQPTTSSAALWSVRVATILAILPGAAAAISIGKLAAGVWGAALAGILYLFSNYHLFFDRLALSDPVAASAVMVALYFTYRLSRQIHLKDGVWMSIALFIGIGAKITVLPYLGIPLAGALTLLPWQEKRKTRLRWTAVTLGISVLLVIGFIAMLQWRGYNVLALLVAQNPNFMRSFTITLPSNVAQTITATITYMGIFLFLLSFAGVVFLIFYRRLFLPLVLLLPPLTILVNQRQSERYYAVPMSILLVCAAVGLGIFIRQWRPAVRAGILGALLAISLAQWLPFANTLYNAPSELTLPGNDQNEYIATDTSGFGLKEIYQALNSANAQEVIGLLSNCQGLRYMALHDFTVICPHLALDGSSVRNQLELVNANRATGYYVVVENTPYVPEADTLPGSLIFTIERPGKMSVLSVYDLSP